MLYKKGLFPISFALQFLFFQLCFWNIVEGAIISSNSVKQTGTLVVSYEPIVKNSLFPSTTTNEENSLREEAIATNAIKKIPKRVQKKEKHQSCSLPQNLINEIKSYENVTRLIFDTVLNGNFKGRTYKELSYFVDKFGSRQFGTENLENAIDYMLEKMVQDEADKVYSEDVFIPKWNRGEETAWMILPRKKKLSLLGLAFSVGTGKEGIKSQVLVVKTFDELREKRDLAVGKIIVFNEEFVTYGETVKYRSQGASEAARAGGIAALIRSVTPFSLNTPHTGQQEYQENVTQIPTACITIEDAQLLQRLQDRGQKIVISLIMLDETLPNNVKSRNSIGEIVGREKPEEIVVISGHIDSWDVGQGAMDDGGGVFIATETLALIKYLNLKPRRSLRTILWTAEEPGILGAEQYVKNHMAQMEKFNAVFESDIGTFRPVGLDFAGSQEAGCIVEEVLKLLAPINATLLRRQSEVGSDIGYFINQGVPGISLNTENESYFWYHHTEADTMVVEDPDSLDLCTAVWAASSYVLADLSVSLPR